MFRPLLLPLFAIATSVFAAEPSRTWTNSSGKTLEGSYVEHSLGKVRVKRADGNVVLLDPKSLSQEDQDYLTSLTSKDEKPASLLGETKSVDLDSRRAKWHTKLEDARKESKETGLPVFIFFTGSDWCGYCIQFHDNVLEKKEFKEFADKNLVLFVADFPRAGSRRSLEKQNNELKDEYGVKGFPTLFLDEGDFKKPAGLNRGSTPAEFISNVKSTTARLDKKAKSED